MLALTNQIFGASMDTHDTSLTCVKYPQRSPSQLYAPTYLEVAEGVGLGYGRSCWGRFVVTRRPLPGSGGPFTGARVVVEMREIAEQFNRKFTVPDSAISS
jgi:hypothetical protein